MIGTTTRANKSSNIVKYSASEVNLFYSMNFSQEKLKSLCLNFKKLNLEYSCASNRINFFESEDLSK